MLLIHPAMQSFAILLAFYTFLMGLQRFRGFHLKHKVKFPWKRHVLVGKIALSILLVGMVVGFSMVRYHWGRNFMTLGHGKMAMVILPFLLSGFISGYLLDRKVTYRNSLRIFHGLNNILLFALLLNQARLGIEVYQLYVAGL